MKIACSSATFDRSIRDGEMTQLDWLDVCANELEVDGVALAAAHFPRTDAEYLAQIKKTAVDLGLAIAAIDSDGDVTQSVDGDTLSPIAIAVATGAPLVTIRAPRSSDEAGAWGAFTEALSSLARAAKDENVTLALGAMGGTLCPDAAGLRRAAKDVDSAWVRFSFDPALPRDPDDERILAKSVIARYEIERPDAFATETDAAAREAIDRLARFRGFVVLDVASDRAPAAYHEALARFAARRANALETSAF